MKNLILFIIALGIAGSIGVVILMALLSRNLPNPNSLTERNISQTTKIFDRTGEHLLYEIFGDENRTLKLLQEGFCNDDKKLKTENVGIPTFVVQATIAAEDRSFCKHGGFDVKGFLRAVFENLKGNRVGGSTLTQQLVKNAILSKEKTLTRKIKELILSLELERRYSKDEILQIYLNEIPYGSTYYGIEAASQNFYRKPANELTLAQAATLASLPKATTVYLNNPDRLLARRNYILGEMEELGFISEEELNTAKQENTEIDRTIINIQAPHFVIYVKEQLEEEYGRRYVEEGGLKVITSLDYDLQIIAEEEVVAGVEAKGEVYGFTNASLVAIDPKTGHILSMVGSKDFFDEEIDGQVNVATRLRQPGSSFKPIVYAKAFELGYTPNTVLWDVLTTFPTVTGDYEPNNYDLEERGPVRVRDALQGSLNIPAVKMIYMVGFENALDFATSLGYSSFGNHANFGLSLVLGGGEVQLLEHVNAYATFANEGVHHDMVSILRVEDSDGIKIQEWKKPDGKRVMDENIAQTLTHVLKDNNARAPFFGESNYLQLRDRQIAAKTGTTNDNRDGWLLGYTPSLAAGVWAGNNDNEAMHEGAGGSSVAGPIWNAFMKRAHENQPTESFTSPTIKQTNKPILDGQITATKLLIDKASGKLATKFTPDSYAEERLFAEYRSILHYVDKDDPTGSVPDNPEDDLQYEAWEAAISEWITRQEEETGVKITQSSPPTEEDDVHIPRNFPNVDITTPSKDQEISGRTISIRANASAPRSVARVEFYIDSLFLGSDSSLPFELITTIPNNIGRGYHSIRAVAYDDVENSGSESIGVRIQDNAQSGNLTLVDPKNGQVIERNTDNYSIVVSLKDPQNYLAATVYAEPIGGGVKRLVGQMLNPSTPFLTFDWTLPEKGKWALSSTARPKNGSQTVTTAGNIIEIVPGEITKEVENNQSVPLDPLVPEEETEDIFTPEEDLTLF